MTDLNKSPFIQFTGWAIALALGSGWLYSWLSEWDALDQKANIVIEVLSKKDNLNPSSDELDAWLACRRVYKKAAYIRIN